MEKDLWQTIDCKLAKTADLWSEAFDLKVDMQYSFAEMLQKNGIAEISVQQLQKIAKDVPVFHKLLTKDEQRAVKAIPGVVRTLWFIEQHDYQWHYCFRPAVNPDNYYEPIWNTKGVYFRVHNIGSKRICEVLVENLNADKEREFFIKNGEAFMYSLHIVKRPVAEMFPARAHCYCKMYAMNAQIQKNIMKKCALLKKAYAAVAESCLRLELPQDIENISWAELVETYGKPDLVFLRRTVMQLQRVMAYRFSKRERRSLKELYENDKVIAEAVCHYGNTLRHIFGNGAPAEKTPLMRGCFIDECKRGAVRFVYKKGWLAEVFVESEFCFDYPVCGKNYFYVIRFVKSLRDVPQLQELMQAAEVTEIRKLCLYGYSLKQM